MVSIATFLQSIARSSSRSEWPPHPPHRFAFVAFQPRRQPRQLPAQGACDWKPTPLTAFACDLSLLQVGADAVRGLLRDASFRKPRPCVRCSPASKRNQFLRRALAARSLSPARRATLSVETSRVVPLSTTVRDRPANAVTLPSDLFCL